MVLSVQPRMARRLAAISLLGCCVLTGLDASAQYEDKGKPAAGSVQDGSAIADRGYELFKQADYGAAVELFKQAETISHSPVIVFFIAEGLERLGRLIEASAYYQAVADEKLPDKPPAPEPVRKAVADAKLKLPLIRQRVPKVTIALSGVPPTGAVVTLNQRKLTAVDLSGPISIDPGRHTVIVTVEGREPITRVFEVAERQTIAINEALSVVTKEVRVPGPIRYRAAPSTVHVAGPSVSYGVAVAGLALGAVTGILYLGRASELKDRCPDGRCIAELEEEKNTLSQLGTAATVGFAVGGAGLVAGTLWLLLAPEPETPEGEESPAAAPPAATQPAVALGVGPQGLVLHGTF